MVDCKHCQKPIILRGQNWIHEKTMTAECGLFAEPAEVPESSKIIEVEWSDGTKTRYMSKEVFHRAHPNIHLNENGELFTGLDTDNWRCGTWKYIDGE